MQYLEKICCFFVFARIFLHMSPSEKYEKYISALISWIAFCIFLSPVLSEEKFAQTYEKWEENWKVRTEEMIGFTAEELEEESEQSAIRMLEEMEEENEMGNDN